MSRTNFINRFIPHYSRKIAVFKHLLPKKKNFPSTKINDHLQFLRNIKNYSYWQKQQHFIMYLEKQSKIFDLLIGQTIVNNNNSWKVAITWILGAVVPVSYLLLEWKKYTKSYSILKQFQVFARSHLIYQYSTYYHDFMI